MNKNSKSHTFFLPTEKDTIFLMQDFTDTVFCGLALDFSKPENVLTIAFNGSSGVGKSVSVQAFLNRIGIEPNCAHAKYFKEYQHKASKASIRHIDAHGLISNIIRLKQFDEEQPEATAFLEDREVGGVEIVEWGNSKDAHEIYKERKDKKFAFNGQSYDYGFHLTKQTVTQNQRQNEKNNPRRLIIICSEEKAKKPKFKTFLEDVEHLRIH